MARPNLLQLQAELAAGGVVLPGALYTDDSGVVRCYDAAGVLTDLPPEAAPLVAAHVPAAPPDPLQRADAPLLEVLADPRADLVQLKGALAAWLRARSDRQVGGPAR